MGASGKRPLLRSHSLHYTSAVLPVFTLTCQCLRHVQQPTWMCISGRVSSKPTGSEVSFMMNGTIMFGIVEENSGEGPNQVGRRSASTLATSSGLGLTVSNEQCRRIAVCSERRH